MATHLVQNVFEIGVNYSMTGDLSNPADNGNNNMNTPSGGTGQLTIHSPATSLTVTDDDGFLGGDPTTDMHGADATGQTVFVDGTDRAVYVDFYVTYTDGINAYQFAVLDVDRNNDGDSRTGPENGSSGQTEDGYYLIQTSGPTITAADVPLTLSYVSIAEVAQPGLAYDTICLARGSRIRTATGEVMVEDLQAGHMIMTLDHGLQPIRWIHSRRLSRFNLMARPGLLPVRIRKGALGMSLPVTDLLVSQQHRMLMRSRIAQKIFADEEVLVPAKKLTAFKGINVVNDGAEVEYFHILLDRHEIIFANGAPTESLFTGRQALLTLGPEAIQEVHRLFPKLAEPHFTPEPARILPPPRKLKKLIARHIANRKSILQMAHAKADNTVRPRASQVTQAAHSRMVNHSRLWRSDRTRRSGTQYM